jgi:selenocysteine-specific elongation factor
MTRAPEAPPALVATAGHVDHGKTSLVRALTGMDTDRLPEEKARAISIECGYAHTTIGGRPVAIVDVPGHERFIRQMVGGVSNMDAVLLVIAADEGVMPQTREHLAIAGLMGIETLVVALTRVDLVDRDWLELVREDVVAELSAMGWPGVVPTPVSVLTGEGLDALRDRLVEALAAASTRRRAAVREGPFALPVDRVFSASGFGTIATGTSLSGTVRVGDTLVVWPSGRPTRVRQIQRHGEAVDRGGPFERLALNLVDLGRDDIPRGAILAAPNGAHAAGTLELSLRVLPGAPRAVSRGDVVVAQVGMATAEARILTLSKGSLAPGAEGPVELRLLHPLPVATGMPLIVRGFERLAGGGLTLGGGRVVAAREAPVRRSRREARAAIVRAFAADDAPTLCHHALLDAGEAGLTPGALAHLLRALRTPPRAAPTGDAAIVGDRLVARSHLMSFIDALKRCVAEHHAADPASPGFPVAELGPALGREGLGDRLLPLVDAAVAAGAVERRAGVVARPGHVPRSPEDDARRAAAAEEILRRAALCPPWRAELPELVSAATGLPVAPVERFVQDGIKAGRFVKVHVDVVFHADALAALLARLDAHLADGGTLSVGDFKTLSGTTRRHAMPLLEWLDKEAFTVRRGELRLRHPRWEAPMRLPAPR